jgi:thermitase
MTNHKTIKGLIIAASVAMSSLATAATKSQDLLIKFVPGMTEQMQVMASALSTQGGKAEVLTDTWMHVQVSSKRAQTTLEALKNDPSVEYVQPNYKVKLLENYQIQDTLRRAAMARGLAKQGIEVKAKPDNPALPTSAPQQATGADPDFSKQWGMNDIGVKDAWKVSTGKPEMIVAVIDTGVDYTHEDLAPNLWRNSKEIAGNGIDDDHNGYVDDVIGWDFVSNDNKPFDLAVDPMQLLMGGGNPGHGTHCAGNVAAKGNNGLGIAGVAPNVRIMSLRFISDKGEGTSADAIKAIKYAVDNGAKVLSNSWGSEGEDPADDAENKGLREIIAYAKSHGVLFIAAAGNGHQGVGYDNDSDSAPGYPASYDFENIISVAAVDSSDKLGAFSNWGAKTVDIAAPGVNVYSTTVGNTYNDKVIDFGGFTATWDGTSMAAPHVAGAAALYWSAHPEKSWQDVKAAILRTAKKISAVDGKVVSDGKLDVKALLNY